MAPVNLSLRSSATASASGDSIPLPGEGPHISLPILAGSVAVLAVVLACLILFIVRYIRSRRPTDYAKDPDAKLSLKLKAFLLPSFLTKSPGSSSPSDSSVFSEKRNSYILPVHQRQISVPTLICGTGPIAIAHPETWGRTGSVQCASSISTPSEPDPLRTVEKMAMVFQNGAHCATDKLKGYKPLVVKKKQQK